VHRTDELPRPDGDAADVNRISDPREEGALQKIGFLGVPEATAEVQRMFDEDIAELGYVMNVSRLWAYQPATVTGLFTLLAQVNSGERLSLRQRFILVTACAAAFGDSYCSLAWGSKLAKASDAQTAARVLVGVDDGLSTSERAMAGWARKVARDPNGTTSADVQELRAAGFSDSQIFTITAFVALRLAFSTVNDALGLRPDAALRSTAPAMVRDAVTFGRPIEDVA
jgi:uncharacterized peroxidase-related enzyme